MRNKFFQAKQQEMVGPFISEPSKLFRSDDSDDSELERDFINLPPTIVIELQMNEEYRNKVAPCKKDKKAFKRFLNESLAAASLHDLKALKYLAKLLVDDCKVASQYGLHGKLSAILSALRLTHMQYIDNLVVMAKNDGGIYRAEVQSIAQKRLDEFLNEGEGYARSILPDNPNYIIDAFFKSSMALNAFANIFEDMNRHYMGKMKPQEFQNIHSILTVFVSDEPVINSYRIIIAHHILPDIKETFRVFPDVKPRLPQSKLNADKYLRMLCNEPYQNAELQLVEGSSEIGTFEDEDDEIINGGPKFD